MNIRRAFTKACFLSLVAGIPLAAVAISVMSTRPHKALAAGQGSAPTRGELLSQLRASGLNPEALAAAGLSDQQVIAVVTAADAALASDLTGHRDRAARLITARQNHERARRAVQRGDESSLQTLQSAATELASVTQAVAGANASFFSSATTVLSSSKRGQIESMRGAAALDLPPAYGATAVEQSNAVTLREALAAERIASVSGTQLDATSAATLAAARADPAVEGAIDAASSRGSSVAQAYATTVATLTQ